MAQFFLLPDEDQAAWAAFAAGMLATLRPADDAEWHAAERPVQAMWREMPADRLEAVILGELFAAGSLADAARAARDAAMQALPTLLRYRARIQRDIDRALHELDCLRERPAPAPKAQRPSEPAAGLGSPRTSPPGRSAEPAGGGKSEPGPPPAANRHERRRLAALERQAERRAA